MNARIEQTRELLRDRPLAVLMGGPGRERDVSLRSGAAVLSALRSVGLHAEAVDVTGPDFSLPSNTFLAFNLVHGTYGEDGGIQAELESRGIAYTGEGVEGSRSAFDKILTKEQFAAAGVPTVRCEVLTLRGQSPSFEFPLVVKAPRQGSSVGVHIVRSPDELAPALDDCFSLDDRVLVEEFFSGKELTVGVLGGRVLPVVEIVPVGGFYDYRHKYTKGGSEYFVPARIGARETASVQAAALRANEALGLSVYCRIDVMLSEDGRINVLEINTIPGMTETSLLPMAASKVGLSFSDLCLEIAAASLDRFS